MAPWPSARERQLVRDRLLGSGPQGAPDLRRTGALGQAGAEEGWDHQSYLAAVLSEEVDARTTHGGDHRVKAARFPATKTLDDFVFSFQRSVKRATMAHLAQLDFLAESKNVMFLGPPGTGKTHVSIALGSKRPDGAIG